MIGLRIGTAELAEIEAGAPAVVMAPGHLLPHAPPLVPLVLKDGVLARPGAAPSRAVPLPATVTLLALVGPEREAEALRPLLPAGLPVLPDAAALLGALAAALRRQAEARLALAGERDRLKRALGTLAEPRPSLALDLAPGGGLVPPGLSQPLGRPAEGLCAIGLHVARASPIGLKITLLAEDRVLARWRVPAEALAPGWLTLHLPEPAPPGPALAVVEIQAEAGQAAPALLSAVSDRPGASLALRAWTAPAGWAVLPRHLDWSACDAPRPVLPLALPAALLAEASIEGARAELVAAGGEEPRLLLDLAPGAEASIRLPPIPIGPADLLRARLALRGRIGDAVEAAFTIETAPGLRVESGWRNTDAAGGLAVHLPLPPGAMARLDVTLRNPGPAPAVVELTGLALQAGAAGEWLAAPPGPMAARPARVADSAPRAAIAMPIAPGPEVAGWRASPPAPPLAIAQPGGTRPAALPDPALRLPSGTSFQGFKLTQHLANQDGSYRHLDVTVSGLLAGGGLWRQVRLKLFERRGAIGLEFRDMAGWPPVFDAWPGSGKDQYGPFWRLEAGMAATGLGQLATAHDRALIAALAEVLPDLAARAAAAAGLSAPEGEAWRSRALALSEAVAGAGAG
ncbi:DUF6212 domain-containing protein [Falsiroseomonas sp.]|uniref:DUF6212 domain-containing protein n=1 Tax=Falsiroseomonas sp. TaxID=2870721 RepID=UPI0034A35896